MGFVVDQDVLRKVSSLLRTILLAPYDGERVAASRALERLLIAAGSSPHALVDRIEQNGEPDEEAMKKLYSAGYAQGVQDAEAKHHGVADFRGTDGKPDWDAVALFLQRNKHRLDPRHHEFVDDMASRTVWGREPTEKQHKYLHSLFFKLGGKIT
jgi:hypothetical protein